VPCRAALLLLFAAGCDSPSPVRAFRVRERSELVGGPGAIGEVGDYILENDRIRIVVAGPGNSVGPGMFGGSIVDVDLRRTSPEFAHGNGLDQFSEVFPMVNLVVSGYVDGAPEEGIGDLSIQVLDDGGDGGQAILRVRGKGDRLVEALDALALVGVRTNLSFETDYVVRPGKPYVEIVTRVRDDDPRGPDAAAGEITQMTPLTGEERTFDALVGPDTEGSGDEGFLGGDFLLFGPKVNVFAHGEGHEVQLLFQRGFEAGDDVVNDALGVPYLAATGDRVSYAYFAPEGEILVPIFSSSFTGAFTAACGFERCGGAPPSEWKEYRRYLSVGEGDVASALEGYWDVRGEPSGRIRGRVLDGRTGAAVSGAQVLAVEEPGEDCADQDDDGLVSEAELAAVQTFELAIACEDIALQMSTDVGTDATHDGDFEGRLAPGRYLLFARTPGGLPTPGVPVEVQSGRTDEVDLVLAPLGRVDVRIVDGAGTPIPGKVTFLGPGECGTAEVGPAGRSALRSLPFGDSELPDEIAAIAFVGESGGTLELEPGEYEAIVSRGVEWSLDRQCVRVDPAVQTILAANVVHVVDTTGWISGDFHIHGMRSYDAAVSHRARIQSALAEGLDLVSTSDHDAIADLGPTAREMGVDHLLATMVGLETTTIETGHTIGFPLRVDDRLPDGGAIDWTRRDACLTDPEGPRCSGRGGVLPLVPDEIFSALRSLATSPADAVVLVPHPRDGFFGYFDQFGLSTFDLSVSPSFLAASNPVLAPENFSPAFDAIELFNAKRFEMIRTPSVGEIAAFRAGSPEGEVARRVLVRTREEQAALDLPEPTCAEAADCEDDEECDPVRRECAPDPVRCTDDGECPHDFACDFGLPPTVPAGCRDPDRPTFHHEGVVDDWFRLLDAGVVYTGMGNSDTHDLHSVEVGLPRNFVLSPTDSPRDVEGRDVAAAVRAHEVVASFGPFVEMWIDGRPIGSTVSPAPDPVEICVRVQTPEWFGAERLEIYRSGALWRVETSLEPPEEIMDFDVCFEDAPTADAWYVAIALSETTSLAPVYTSVAHAQLGFSQVAALAFAAIDSPLIALVLSETPKAPEITEVVPYAVTNPIWVDREGDGFDAPDPTPAWAIRTSASVLPPLSRLRTQSPFTRPDALEARRRQLVSKWAEDAFGD